MKSIDEKKVAFYKDLMELLDSQPEKNINIDEDGVIILSIKQDNIQNLFPKARLKKSSFLSPKLVLLWGLGYNEHARKALLKAKSKKIPCFIVEDGLIKSIATWCDSNVSSYYKAGVSFMFDCKGAYYDATRETQLEKLLNDKNLVVSEKNIHRAKILIKKIIDNKLTKYNYQSLNIPTSLFYSTNRKKVLVVDQSYGDISIEKGFANKETFSNMLTCAIKENPEADIFVKVHPDTLTGNRGAGYFYDIEKNSRVFILAEKLNPISLLKCIDSVYVVTSQLGFEALMCGKDVHVFGLPFYAGWGITKDRQKCERRKNLRSLEEIFYITYIIYTYWVNPKTGKQCEIEEALDFLIQAREEFNNGDS